MPSLMAVKARRPPSPSLKSTEISRNCLVQCAWTTLQTIQTRCIVPLYFARHRCLIGVVRGELAEWLRSGLQIRLHRFDSGTRLHPSFHIDCWFLRLWVPRG